MHLNLRQQQEESPDDNLDHLDVPFLNEAAKKKAAANEQSRGHPKVSANNSTYHRSFPAGSGECC